MALSIADLRTRTAITPPRVLIYGPPGIGKTELASEFPSPVFLDIENGLPPGRDIANFADLDGFDAVMEAIGALYTEDHEFRTVIVDTLDRLEPLVWAKVCADNNWKSIEAPGYGKGYVEADRYWRDLVDGLNALRRDKGMAVVLVGHSTVERFDSPTSASYSRFDIRLHKRAQSIIQDEVDAILFVNQDATIKSEDVGFNKKRTQADGGGLRWIHCEGRPAYTAKNRYGLPYKYLFKRGEGYAQLAPGFGQVEKPAPQPARAPRKPAIAA